MEVLRSRQEFQEQSHLEDPSEGASSKHKQLLERGEAFWLFILLAFYVAYVFKDSYVVKKA